MFALTRRAAKAGKTSLKPTAREKLLDTVGHDAAQWARAGFEAFFVFCDVLVEVLLEHLIKNRGFRMAGAINSRGITYPKARIRRAVMRVLSGNLLGFGAIQKLPWFAWQE